MITEEELLDMGFIPNPYPHQENFDDYEFERALWFTIGNFNDQGYLIEGIDRHEPIKSAEDLRTIINILFPVST